MVGYTLELLFVIRYFRLRIMQESMEVPSFFERIKSLVCLVSVLYRSEVCHTVFSSRSVYCPVCGSKIVLILPPKLFLQVLSFLLSLLSLICMVTHVSQLLEQISTWRAPAWRRSASSERRAWWRTARPCASARTRVRRTKTPFAAMTGTRTAAHAKWRPWDAPYRNKYRFSTKDHVVSTHIDATHSLVAFPLVHPLHLSTPVIFRERAVIFLLRDLFLKRCT